MQELGDPEVAQSEEIVIFVQERWIFRAFTNAFVQPIFPGVSCGVLIVPYSGARTKGSVSDRPQSCLP